MYARGDVNTSELVRHDLKAIRDDDPFERHTVIIGWPAIDDLAERKERWLEIALHLSQAATYLSVPRRSQKMASDLELPQPSPSHNAKSAIAEPNVYPLAKPAKGGTQHVHTLNSGPYLFSLSTTESNCSSDA